MPKRIIFTKSDNIGTPPEGYTLLGVNEFEQSTTTNDKGETFITNSPDSRTLISDQEFYTWGTYSVFPLQYLAPFSIGDKDFHLVEMLTKLPVHDFFDQNLESQKYFGIFKEENNKLTFVDIIDFFGELNIDLSDYSTIYKCVTSISIQQEGTGYTQSYTLPTTGGSGKGLYFNISGEVGEISFDDVGNSFPILGYAGSTVNFLAESNTGGSGFGLEIQVLFDGYGYPDSYTIVNPGSEYIAGSKVTTNDPYSGIIYFKITQLSQVNSAAVSVSYFEKHDGSGYEVDDLVTVIGGNNDLIIKIEDVQNNNYGFNLFSYDYQKVENGIKFYVHDGQYGNSFFQFLVELNEEGIPQNYTLLQNRKLDDENFKIQGYEFFDKSTTGAYKFYNGNERSYWGFVLNNSVGDPTKINMIREELWVNRKVPSWSNQKYTFTQIDSTGIGTGFQVEIEFDPRGCLHQSSILSAGASHSVGNTLTITKAGGGELFAQIVQVDENGAVTEFSSDFIDNTGDYLTPYVIDQNSIDLNNVNLQLCSYNFVTLEIDVSIPSIKNWWEEKADEPWFYDGKFIDYKGGLCPHPDEPTAIVSRSYGDVYIGEYKSSVLVTKDNFFRLPTQQMQDFSFKKVTKSKLYMYTTYYNRLN